MSYLVVGGGVAGLVVARRLAMSGAAVTVYESSDYAGGIVTSQTVGGLILDAGAESFATRGGTVAALATELGLGDDIVTPLSEPAWLYRAAGEPLPLPATSVLGIPAVPLAADVIAVVGYRAAFRAYLDVLISDRVGRSASSLGELVSKRMGDRMLDRLVTPVVRGVHSAHPNELELDRVAPFLRAALKSEGSLTHAVRLLRASAPAGSAIAGIRGGINRLVVELLADLSSLGVTLELNATVSEVDANSVVVNGSRVYGEPIVAASGLLEPNDRRDITLATLVVDVPELDAHPRGTGLLVADGAPGIRARALTHSTAKWSWLAERADGKHVLRLSYDGGQASAEVAREDAAKLMGVAIPASAVLDFAIVNWTRPAPEAPHGVTATGEAVGGSGLAAVVKHAEETAARLLADSVPLVE